VQSWKMHRWTADQNQLMRFAIRPKVSEERASYGRGRDLSSPTRCDVSLMRQIERQPRWVGIPARVFAFTILLTLLSFAVALLISILGTIVYSQIEHVAPNLVFAYKHIAFPIALSVGAVVLMVSLVVEIQNYRQNKILAAIERTATLNH